MITGPLLSETWTHCRLCHRRWIERMDEQKVRDAAVFCSLACLVTLLEAKLLR